MIDPEQANQIIDAGHETLEKYVATGQATRTPIRERQIEGYQIGGAPWVVVDLATGGRLPMRPAERCVRQTGRAGIEKRALILEARLSGLLEGHKPLVVPLGKLGVTTRMDSPEGLSKSDLLLSDMVDLLPIEPDDPAAVDDTLEFIGLVKKVTVSS